jgi:PKD repeat protein
MRKLMLTLAALAALLAPAQAEANQPPRAIVDPPGWPNYVGTNVYFFGNDSYDTDGSIVSYTWDFGDGTGTTGDVVSPGHAYEKPGWYDVTLTVTDDQGDTDWDSISVFIHSIPPTASFTVSGTHNAQEKLFDASQSTDSDGIIAEYRWDFCDGTSGSGVSAVHRFASEGTYTVTLTAVDDAGELNSSPGSVVIRLSAPTARLGYTSGVCAGADILLTATASDRDGHIVDYQWDLDGTGAFARDTHDTSHTRASYTTPGVHRVAVRVTDDSGLTAVSARDVTVRECTHSVTTPAPAVPATPAAPSSPSLRAPASMRLRARSLIVEVRCGAACSIAAQLRAAGRSVGHAAHTLPEAGTARFRVWLDRDTWRRLRDRRRLMLVVIVDQQGNPAVTIRRRVRLHH